MPPARNTRGKKESKGQYCNDILCGFVIVQSRHVFISGNSMEIRFRSSSMLQRIHPDSMNLLCGFRKGSVSGQPARERIEGVQARPIPLPRLLPQGPSNLNDPLHTAGVGGSRRTGKNGGRSSPGTTGAERRGLVKNIAAGSLALAGSPSEALMPDRTGLMAGPDMAGSSPLRACLRRFDAPAFSRTSLRILLMDVP